MIQDQIERIELNEFLFTKLNENLTIYELQYYERKAYEHLKDYFEDEYEQYKYAEMIYKMYKKELRKRGI